MVPIPETADTNRRFAAVAEYMANAVLRKYQNSASKRELRQVPRQSKTCGRERGLTGLFSAESRVRTPVSQRFAEGVEDERT